MATVYRGRHNTLNREVAIKVLHPHLSASTRNRKRFAREARAIEHLRHANILEIFDYSGIDASDCYIITEFVDGITLTELRERTGRLPSEITTMIGMHLARALQYAHVSGILHRDIKPDNVMVRSDGTVKLMDFGIARFLDESQVTMTGALVGSPAFMSPEQAKETTLDQRSDLFSLGTVLFNLVTGHLPFAGNNPSLILRNIIEGNRPHVAELAPTLSAALADVIERLLATNADERYLSAHDVLIDLESALAEVEVDPDDPRWAITSFIATPEDYTTRLDEHLGEVLLRHGRQLLDAGNPLAALRLFNRLLTMDEDNAEVLELVQSLHEPEPSRPRGALPVLAMVAIGVLLGGGAWGWSLSHRPPTEASASPTSWHISNVMAQPTEVGPIEADIRPKPPPAPRATSHKVMLPPTPRPTPPPPLDAPGSLHIVSDMVADIYDEDGDKLGTTRDTIRLDPGTRVLTLRSDVVPLQPMTIKVDISSDEHIKRVVRLRPQEITLKLGPNFDPTCAVVFNGQYRGTVGSIGGKLAVPQPDRPNLLELTCSGQKYSFSREYILANTTFHRPDAP